MKSHRGAASIGIDIGGTKTLCALFDKKFEVVAEEKLRTTPKKGGAGAFTAALRAAVYRLLAAAHKRGLTVKYAGVGCAGDIDLKRGIVRSSPNLKFLEGYPLREQIERLTGTKAFVAHDVQAALYGELRLGVARKACHVIGVWLGTGVGGALVIDRKLHLGISGQAGNVGNYSLHAVDVSLEMPRKERLDNLDSLASRAAIAGHAAVLAASHRAPRLRKIAGTDVRAITASSLAAAVRDGDKSLQELVTSRAGAVGIALSNLVDFINPDMIVLGGGLAEAMPDLLRKEIRKALAAHCTPKAAKAVRVRTSQLLDHAGPAGAACLAIDMFSDNPPLAIDAM